VEKVYYGPWGVITNSWGGSGPGVALLYKNSWGVAEMLGIRGKESQC